MFLALVVLGLLGYSFPLFHIGAENQGKLPRRKSVLLSYFGASCFAEYRSSVSILFLEALFLPMKSSTFFDVGPLWEQVIYSFSEFLVLGHSIKMVRSRIMSKSPFRRSNSMLCSNSMIRWPLQMSQAGHPIVRTLTSFPRLRLDVVIGIPWLAITRASFGQSIKRLCSMEYRQSQCRIQFPSDCYCINVLRQWTTSWAMHKTCSVSQFMAPR